MKKYSRFLCLCLCALSHPARQIIKAQQLAAQAETSGEHWCRLGLSGPVGWGSLAAASGSWRGPGAEWLGV